MDRQILIAVGREFGSGGHEIGKRLAKNLGINFYDRKMLDELAEKKNIRIEFLEKYDEEPRKFFGARSVDVRTKSYSNSIEEIIADMQSEYIKEKADSGESFVIVGRCAEEVLKGREGLVSVFILGDMPDKIERTRLKFGIDEKDAELKIKRHDRTRKKYHNAHADGKWGDSRTYDICINSSRLGIDGTVEMLKKYIEAYFE